MDTQKISMFLRVIELGSYNKASETLGYTPSALSYIIKQVEADIGMPLVNKDHKGLTLTPAGERIIPLFRQLLYTEEEIRRFAADETQTHRSRIRIASYPCLTWDLIPKAIIRFNRQYPDVQIQLITATGDEVCKMVSSGNADIGIADIDYIKDLDWQPLRCDHYMMAVPSGFLEDGSMPSRLEDFNRWPCLISNYTPTHLLGHLKEHGFTDFQQIYTYIGQSMLAMVNQGFGITLVSELNQPVCPKDVTLCTLEPPLTRDFLIIAKDFQKLDQTTLDFTNVLKEICKRI